MPILSMGLTLYEMNRVSPGTNIINDTNSCVMESTDGTWYGYDSSVPMGAVDPVYTKDGTFTYAVKWQADGTILMKFGDAGNEQLTDIDGILISYADRSILLMWDDIAKDYRTVDTDMTDYLIADYEDGKERCYLTEILPDLLIHYTFSTIETGAA